MPYVKTEWETGDLVTATKLNKIEQGIEDNDTAISELVDDTLATTGKAADAKAVGDALATKVPATRTVAGKALSADVTLTAGDVEYDSTTTYSSGTIGAETAALKTAFTQKLMWGQGTINATTGEGDATTSTSASKGTRIKSSVIVPLTEHATINLKDGYQYGVRKYASDGTFIESVGWSTDTSITFETDKQYRFIAAHLNDSPIQPKEDPFTITYHFANDALAEKDYYARTELNPILQSRHSDNVDSKILTLLHFSDIHASQQSIDDIWHFYLRNKTYIDGIINTGDTQYELADITALGNTVEQFDPTVTYSAGDFVKWGDFLYQVKSGQSFSGTFTVNKCNYRYSTLCGYIADNYLESDFYKNTFYTIGNHDTRIDNYNSDGTITTNYVGLPKSEALARYFSNIEQQPLHRPSNDVMYWYGDYTGRKIRLIGLDVQYWDATELSWFETTLADAKTNGYAVIIAAHCPPGGLTGYTNTAFTNLESPNRTDSYSSFGAYTENAAVSAISDFIDDGGNFICWICGHNHRDRFAYCTALPTLTVAQIECAGAYHNNVHNSNRKRYDLYSTTSANVITVDPIEHLIKLVRFGNNMDNMMRVKNYLCFDYANRQLIT